MTSTATTDTSAAAPTAGEPRELARYITATGTERVLGGQRVDGVADFLPGKRDVLVVSSRPGEDDRGRPRGAVNDAERANAARRRRLRCGGVMRELRIGEWS
jgi:hypothetical protein